jgi:hypothetical protein
MEITISARCLAVAPEDETSKWEKNTDKNPKTAPIIIPRTNIVIKSSVRDTPFRLFMLNKQNTSTPSYFLFCPGGPV